MIREKGLLQKISIVSAGLSFVLALVTGVLLYLRLDSVGANNPISASLMASTFFFLCVGAVLGIMGSADLPNLKIGDSE